MTLCTAFATHGAAAEPAAPKLAPEAVVLGAGTTVEVLIPNGAAAVAQSALVPSATADPRRWQTGPWLLVAEAGRLEPLPPLGGDLRARWHIPPELTPRRLAMGLVDTRTGTAGFALLAVSRRARLHISASPNAHVRLGLGGQTAAEGLADARGKLDLSVVVAPAMNVAALAQEVGGHSDALLRLQELGVRNALHAFAFVEGEPLLADGASSTPAHVLVFRDDGTIGCDALEMTASGAAVQTPESRGQGVYSALVRAGPYRTGAPASLTLAVVAQQATLVAHAEVPVSLEPLAPSRLVATTPPSFLAGEVYEITVAVEDAGGRVFRGAALSFEEVAPAATTRLDVTYVGERGDGRHVLLVRTPQRMDDAARARSVQLVATGGPLGATSLRAAMAIAVSPGPPASLALAAQVDEDGAMVTALASDRFGNRVAVAPEVRASSGTFAPMPNGEPAVHRWRPPDHRHSSPVTLEATLGGTALTASTSFTYHALAARWHAGAGAGYATDLRGWSAPSLSTWLTFAARDEITLTTHVGLARAARHATVDTTLNATTARTSLVIPATLGGAGQLLLPEPLALHLGLELGLLTSVASTKVTSPSGVLAPARTRVDVALIWQLQIELAARLGRGEAVLSVGFWDALSETSTFADRPRALVCTLGYHWGILP